MHERHFVLVLPFFMSAVFGECPPDSGGSDANFMRFGLVGRTAEYWNVLFVLICKTGGKQTHHKYYRMRVPKSRSHRDFPLLGDIILSLTCFQ